MKKVFAVFLAVCILASLGISAFADAADYPWGASGSQSVRVVISDGVVNVPAAAFAGMKNITSVMLPASVVNIEGAAFGDSVIAEVRTVGDPEVLEGVKAFENAEIIQISQDEFDAAVKAITDNPTEVGEKGSYIISGTSLLIRLFEKLTVPAAPFWLYGDEGSNGGTSESGGPFSDLIFDEQGRLIGGTFHETDAYGNIRETNFEIIYDSEDKNSPFTVNENWKSEDGSYGKMTTSYDGDGHPIGQWTTSEYRAPEDVHLEQTTTFENGLPAERTTTMERSDGSSSKSTTKYNEKLDPTETTSSWTNPDGSSEEGTKQYKYYEDGTLAEVTETSKSSDGSSETHTRKYNENGIQTEESGSRTTSDGSGEYTHEYDENGNLTKSTTIWTNSEGNTEQYNYEYKYDADGSHRKVTYSDSYGNERKYWETQDELGNWVDDSTLSPESP